MHIVLINIHVKPDSIDPFITASIENAMKSRKEPGIARFDVIQQSDDPTRFVLVEVYRTAPDQAKHKETAHYNKWRQLAEPLMVEARSRISYSNVFPPDKEW
jgi:autoinducer 2-degrading protein